MGKLQPRSFERIRSGEQIQPTTFTNVAAAVAAGVTAAKFPRRIIYLSAGGTGSVPCLAISDGSNWRQIAIGIRLDFHKNVTGIELALMHFLFAAANPLDLLDRHNYSADNAFKPFERNFTHKRLFYLLLPVGGYS